MTKINNEKKSTMKYGAHDQDGRAGECKTLPPSMSQSKIHVHAEQYSLKTANSWRLTESLLRTQGCQIEPPGVSSGGKINIRLGSVPLEGDSVKKGDYKGRGPLWGARSSSYMSVAALGSDTWSWEPRGLRGLVRLKGGVWEGWASLMRSEHMRACTQNGV